jgi:hypothetical protein
MKSTCPGRGILIGGGILRRIPSIPTCLVLDIEVAFPGLRSLAEVEGLG